MKAILFPGQGSQVVGMGLDLYKNFKHVREIFSEADEVLKFKLSKIILDGPNEDLKLTQNTQPAIMLVSYSIFSTIKKNYNFDYKDYRFFTGHSLGEYSSLVCSEVLTFKDALFLLYERGKAMQEAVPVGKGAMLAVLGCEISEVKQFLDELKENGVCQIANDNAPGQIIVSGNTSKINELHKTLKSQKKKAIPLPVSAPFHCDLMKIAADKMRDKILSTKFNNSLVPLVSNVTANEEKIENIQKLLIDQIFSKVRWRESIINMSKKGVNEYIEIGPGKVLSGLIKRINKDVKSTSINSIEDIESNFNGIKK